MLSSALLLVLSAGCNTVRYHTNLPGGGGRRQETASFFLWGLVGEKVVNLDAVCPSGTARWQNEKTFLDGFLEVVTLGIYTPRTITMECASPVVAPAPVGAP